jgi:hypothetical protein
MPQATQAAMMATMTSSFQQQHFTMAVCEKN